MLICLTCHQRNSDGMLKCHNCGAVLDVVKGKAEYIDTGGGPEPVLARELRPLPMVPPHPVPTGFPVAYPNPYQMQPLAFCPTCRSQFPTIVRRRIAPAGWVTFAVLCVFFLPLCWIGLLVKEDYRVCGRCGGRVG